MWLGIYQCECDPVMSNVTRNWKMWSGIDKCECESVLTNMNVISYWQMWMWLGIDKCDLVLTNVFVIWYWQMWPGFTNVNVVLANECDPLMVVVHVDRYFKINPHESKLKWSILCLLWS